MVTTSRQAASSGRPLDALNFFLADVRDGLGPYLAIYLLTVQKWDEASIGVVMTIAGIAGIATQTPAGALVDRTKAKRALVIVAAVLVTATCVALPFLSNQILIAGTQAIAGAAGAIFAPATSAITLGIVGPKAFAARVGRNESFNHAGNAFAATLAAVLAYWYGPVVVFWLMAFMAVASVVATWSIPEAAIDHDVARGLQKDGQNEHERAPPSGWRVLLECRPLLIFSACIVLFHFSNAAMLPLAGQKLALGNAALGTSLMSACIVAAQLIMVPVALIAGAKANTWGSKPLFLTAFAVLALRGMLYPLSDSPYWIVGVQLLDGVGAGIFGALFPIVVADLTRGTGHFNVSLGAIGTATGIGAALSTSFAGLIVVNAGYDAAFLALAFVAALGLAVYAVAMPETRDGLSSSAPVPTAA
ncbi:MFS transporter [Hyphomicrobium sp. LHD-15]|uniref:MFS transporter n=1 Tax=Hyphomicrobium sp. LHD-15 TaxID=3072142 RepID=UPI00280DF260|nr:MFS transporter [Hyphomicrobium sp. LHD-15]MDQ8698366.1 MFS transporter [Hyphomicrobium sp. LHD-15]